MDSQFSVKKSQLEKLEELDIQQILNSAYKILGNPIILYDTSYNLFAYTEGIVTDDPPWNEIVTNWTFTPDSVDFFKREDFIKASASTDIVSMMKSSYLKYDRITGKLFDKDDVQLANITIIACCRPFYKEEEEMELIEFLSEILSVKLQQSEFYQRIDRVYNKTIINRLIDGDIKKFTKNTLLELYSGLKANIYLAVVDIFQYDNTITHLAYFRDLFRRIQPEFKYYIHLNNVIIIISTDEPVLRVKEDLKELDKLFREKKLYAGISSEFKDLKKTKKYYYEALNALNYGLKSMINNNIFSYNNYKIECFIRHIDKKNKINELYNPVIYLIQSYDKENNTSFLNTLYKYLLYGNNAEFASRVLEISLNELYDRLEKIEELFAIDFKNGSMLFSLFLSIKLLIT